MLLGGIDSKFTGHSKSDTQQIFWDLECDFLSSSFCQTHCMCKSLSKPNNHKPQHTLNPPLRHFDCCRCCAASRLSLSLAGHPPSFMLATALLACLIVALTSAAAETRVSSSTAQPPPSATLAAIERLGVWWQRPRQPLDIRPYLPAARPVQPWPYRPLSSAQHAAVTQSRSTYALTGVVQHAPLKGEECCVTGLSLTWRLCCSYCLLPSCMCQC